MNQSDCYLRNYAQEHSSLIFLFTVHHLKSTIKSIKSVGTQSIFYLLKSPCVLNVSLHQRTALCVAAEEGQLDIVKYFVDRGLDINSMDNKGVSILCSSYPYGFKYITLLNPYRPSVNLGMFINPLASHTGYHTDFHYLQ